MGKHRRVHATRDQLDAGRIHFRVIVQDIAARRVRHGDDFFAPGHDLAIAVHRVQAMHGGDKARPAIFRHTFPGLVRHPGRHARAGMQDVHLLFLEKGTQAPHPAQGPEGFLANGPLQVAAALAGEP